MPQAICRLTRVVDKHPQGARKRDTDAVLPINLGHPIGEGSVKLADPPDILAIDFVAVRFVCRAQSTNRSRGKHSLADNCSGYAKDRRSSLCCAISEPDIIVCWANHLEKPLVLYTGI